MANKISGIDGRPVQVGGSSSVSRAKDATSGDRKTESTSEGAPGLATSLENTGDRLDPSGMAGRFRK